MTASSRPISLHEKRSSRRRHLYEGQTKTLFDGPEPGTFVLYFKDDCCRLDNVIVTGKGVINNRSSEMFMERLNEIGVQTHFLKRLNMREQLVRATEALPFYSIVHNLALGDFAKLLNLEEGMILPESISEFHVKTENSLSTLVSDRHIITLGWAREDELETIQGMTQRINDFLCGQFIALGLRLAKYRLEFGRIYLSDYFDDTQIVLIDEISLDSCCVLDVKTGDRWDVNFLNEEELKLCDQRSTYHRFAERFKILNVRPSSDLYCSQKST